MGIGGILPAWKLKKVAKSLRTNPVQKSGDWGYKAHDAVGEGAMSSVLERLPGRVWADNSGDTTTNKACIRRRHGEAKIVRWVNPKIAHHMECGQGGLERLHPPGAAQDREIFGTAKRNFGLARTCGIWVAGGCRCRST